MHISFSLKCNKPGFPLYSSDDIDGGEILASRDLDSFCGNGFLALRSTDRIGGDRISASRGLDSIGASGFLTAG